MSAESKGNKRYVSAALSAVSPLADSVVPGAGFLTQAAAGGVGAVGLGHAFFEGEIAEHALASLSALAATLVAASFFFAPLGPAGLLLGKATAALGVFTLANKAVKNNK